MQLYINFSILMVTAVRASVASHYARQATQSSNGAAIEQTATSLILPISSITPDDATGLAGVDDVDNNITSWAKLWGWEGCKTKQKSAVLNGLSEAHTVLGTDGVYNIQNHWNDYATVEFFASPWRHKVSGGRDKVQQNYNRAWGYQQHWYSGKNTRVFCLSDTNRYCREESGFINIDNTYSSDGISLAFCERYFRLGTLNGIYNAVHGGPDEHDLSQYENRARAWITAIMRIKWIGNLKPPTVIYPGNIPGKAESASQTNNPSNYAWYALAQWVQQKSGKYAHRPQTPYELDRAWR